MHLAGSVNSVFSLDLVEADGRNAARQALSNLGSFYSETSPVEDATVPSRSITLAVLEAPKGREFVDFDEDLQIKDIINATRMGYRDIQLVKVLHRGYGTVRAAIRHPHSTFGRQDNRPHGS